MKRPCRTALFIAIALFLAPRATFRQATGADAAANPLLGVWVAKSMTAGGKEAPAEVAKRMRFEFLPDKLLVRGNFDDDREQTAKYAFDLKKSPHWVEFTPADENTTVRGIFKVDGDELTVCLLHADAKGDRPDEFSSPAGSRLVLIVFKKQQP